MSDLKKNTLEEFLKDEVVLAKIADVLNMRFVDLEGWSWDANLDNGIPVAPCRQLNGKYRIVMVSLFGLFPYQSPIRILVLPRSESGKACCR